MTIAVGTPLAGLAAPVHGLGASLRRILAPALALAVCAGGLSALVGPVLRTSEPAPAAGTVTVRVLGTLSTAGLPAAAAVSTLTIRNEGSAPLEWSARPDVTGPGAAGVVVETWLPGASGCTAPTRLLGATQWSSTPLQPGGSTPLCVRVSATGTAAGAATPHVDVAARAV